MIVRTVLGDIPQDQLGHTQCHEHIFLKKGPSYDINPALCMDDFGRSRKELEDYKAAGGLTILDAQPGGYGRDAEALRKLSETTGVNIVAVTGFHKQCFMEADEKTWQSTASESEIAEVYLNDVLTGMREGTGVSKAKAGVVKVAFGKGGFEDALYAKQFEACANAARTAGAPVLIHTEKETDILSLIDFFGDHGIAPDRLIICHLDRTNSDPLYHEEVLKRGCYLCFDSIHRLKYLSEKEEMALLMAALEKGYVRQMLLSLDTTSLRLRSYGATDMGLDYILRTFIPTMLKAGITDRDIDLMCRVNPGRALAMLNTPDQ